MLTQLQGYTASLLQSLLNSLMMKVMRTVRHEETAQFLGKHYTFQLVKQAYVISNIVKQI